MINTKSNTGALIRLLVNPINLLPMYILPFSANTSMMACGLAEQPLKLYAHMVQLLIKTMHLFYKSGINGPNEDFSHIMLFLKEAHLLLLFFGCPISFWKS